MHGMSRLALLLAILAGPASAGWLPTIDTITNRSVSDVTCHGNAHAVVEDTFGNIHVVWRGAFSGVQRVWYSRLSIEADTWTTDTVISDTGPVTDPAIAADSSGNIIVVWTGGSRLYARRLGATGQWLPIVSAAGSSGDSSVSVACDRLGTAHIVWLRYVGTDQLVLHAQCEDTLRVSIDTVCPQTPVLRQPSVAAAPDGDLMVVWNRSGDQHEIVARRRNSGFWLEPETVYNYQNCTSPSVARTPDGSFHLVWVTGTSSSNVVTYRERRPNGWAEVESLTTFRRRNTSVSVTGDAAGNVWAAWAGPNAANRYRVFCRRRPTGSTWLNSDTLSTSEDEKERVSIAAAVGTAQATWSERLTTPPQPWQIRLRRYLRIHDVGVATITAPVGVIDSGSVVTPSTFIANYGRTEERNVAVRLRIGSVTSERRIPALVPRGRVTVQFDQWTAESLGWLFVSCSTSVAGDEEPRNDTLETRFFVRLRDVKAESIIAPVGETESLSVVPRLRVRNRGNVRHSFWCRCWIDSDTGTVYKDSTLAVVDSAGTITVVMDTWLTRPGSCRVRFALDSDDMHPENDTISAGFTVVRHDVGVVGILRPPAGIDSGEVSSPGAVVRNFGSRTESFRVLFRIGAVYSETAVVHGLMPSETVEVTFAEWQAGQRGSHAVICSTMLSTDRLDSNDCRRTSVSVVVRDAACTRITRPVGVVGRGQIEPEAWYENRGTDTIRTRCWFEITDNGRREYLDSAELHVAPGAGCSVEFGPWLAHSGHYLSRAWAALERDMRPENDTSTSPFLVPRIDAALREIVEPVARFATRAIIPKLKVANLSEMPADIRVICQAFLPDSTMAYSGTSMALALPETAETVVNMPVWNALPGLYHFIAWTVLPGDSNPENDSAAMVVLVESVPFGRWFEMAPIPDGPRGIPVRGGSGLVATPTSLFALKGSNSGEWYCYCIEADSWQPMKPVPAQENGRRAGRGAALTSGGDTIFLLRGMGTHDMLMYAPDTDSWQAAPSLPGQTRGIRFGSGLAFVPARDTGKVYCLKGGGTRDFLVFWCRQRQWHARRSLPASETGRGARRGSALVSLGGRVFCLLGITNELFEYAHKGDSWIRRRSLPLVSRSGYLKRGRAGACFAADGSRFLYALKGGGCNELWRYDAVTDNWLQLDDVPLGRSRRRVKVGAGIAVFEGSVWMMKGGGCSEFWRYEPVAALVSATRAQTVAPEQFTGNRPAHSNPGLPTAGPALPVRVRDVTGRVVGIRDKGRSENPSAGSGVFFLEFATEHGPKIRKVVIVR